MLRKETVSDALFGVLNRLMILPDLADHRLVGGTALALQIGHRISVDIDLFSASSSDYQIIENSIITEFQSEAKRNHYISSPLGKGISWLIEGVKVDMIDWKKAFVFPAIETDGIRLANLQEIASMKLDIITSPPEFIRYEKKDFVDLAFLMDELSLSEIISLFRKSNPETAFPDRIVAEALQMAELADKKPDPKMLKHLPWEDAKSKINEAVRNYLLKPED
jgi:hypothetical protein